MQRDQFLQAVLERDAHFDGQFVYGVSSTHIFCRASCPSRRPKLENIVLFEGVEAAQSAGFRACQRCQPEKFAARLDAIADKSRGEETMGGVSTHDFEAAMGISPRQLEEAKRVERLKTELQKGNSVIEAQNEAEFGSSRGVYEAAQKHLGMTPATYGKGGAGANIRFTCVPCSLGQLLVARTDKGVCAVRLGDDEAILEDSLRNEFFAATLTRDDEGLRAEIEAVLGHLSGQEPNPALPLDVRATAFQWRVWQGLRATRGRTGPAHRSAGRGAGLRYESNRDSQSLPPRHW
jgi:AraC family transcriptional regulator of adaptative response/methylated-DNA-[protein]-cysteine methyltransferase